MTVIFDKGELMGAISPAASVVPGHNSSAAIDGILFECPGEEAGTCRISAYDMEKGVRTTVPARILDEGKFILNTQKVLQIVRSLPDGDIEIAIDQNMTARISSGQSSFEISAVRGEDFPGLPLLSGDRNYEFTGRSLRQILSKAIICAAQNDTRPALNGVFFGIEGGVMTVVGCDGNRMAICEKELPTGAPDAKMIVPARMLSEILKVVRDSEDECDTVLMSIARKHVIFTVGGILYFTRLIDTEYMDYARILPHEHTGEVFASASEIRGALERASIITEDKLGGNSRTYVRFDIGDSMIKISSVSTGGSIYEEIPAAKTGEDLTIGFTCRYLLDALRTCPEAYTLRIRYSGAMSGVRIEEARGSGIEEYKNGGGVPEGFDRPDSDGDERQRFLFYIMPRRMTN